MFVCPFVRCLSECCVYCVQLIDRNFWNFLMSFGINMCCDSRTSGIENGSDQPSTLLTALFDHHCYRQIFIIKYWKSKLSSHKSSYVDGKGLKKFLSSDPNLLHQFIMLRYHYCASFVKNYEKLQIVFLQNNFFKI